MGKPLGPRTTIKFGKVSVYKRTAAGGTQKKTDDAYIRPLKSVADYFGISGEKIVTKKGIGGRTYSVRGTSGAGSIKLPTAKKVKGVTRYKSLPVPAQATIPQIKLFLNRVIKKAKPDHFVSPDGRSWPL